MCIRAQNANLLASVFQTWPNLIFKIPQDRVTAPEAGLPTSPSQLLLSTLSVSSSRTESTHLHTPSPMNSRRAPPPPPPQPMYVYGHIHRYSRDVDLSGMDFTVPKTLRSLGMTLPMLWDSQCYSWPQLLSAGFPLQLFKQLRNSQNTAAQLHNMSVTTSSNLMQSNAMSVVNNPIQVSSLSDGPWQCHLTVLELRKAGYTIQQCRDAGFDAAALLAGGFSELDLVCSRLFTTKQLQRVGCDIQRVALKELFDYTEGRHWRNKGNWNTSEPISSWFGVWVSIYFDD